MGNNRIFHRINGSFPWDFMAILDLSNMGIFSWDLPSGNLTLAMEHRLF